ncbi:MAG: alpha/beta hydrolase fold domain-containing protein [Acidobacteria bacterium]|nr:alpha/beta hydrolase fold domain-containing protein [Acidobacteriota bacterium]
MKLLVAAFAMAASLFAADVVAPTGKPSEAAPPGVTLREDLVYAAYGSRELRLDLFTPNRQGPRPGVVVVHGGGWRNGDKLKFRAFCADLAGRGYAAACIEYRLSGEARFPAALYDAKAAVRWMRAVGPQYGVDPERIAAIGGSAGGHLVGLLATSARIERLEGLGGNAGASSAIQAAVILGGAVDLVSQHKADNGPTPPNALAFFGSSYADDPAIYAEASAVTHLDRDDPPTLFLDCGLDSPGERYIGMRRRLNELGIPNEFDVLPGGKHGCWNSQPWFDPMMDRIDGFFQRRLEP